MKISESSLLRKSAALVVSYTCQRWSVVAPLIVYVALFTMVKLLAIPLRSDTIELSSLEFHVKTDQNFNEESKSTILLEDVFHKADTNKDTGLSQEEVAEWISKKTNEHIHEAMMENYNLFTSIDHEPKNGLVSWDEYHKYFLQKNGFSLEYTKSHSPKHRSLSRNLREEIMRDKAAWSESAKTDPDHLTVDEFLAFRHPESSSTNIMALVDDLIEKFDRDGDAELTEEEFASLQSEVEGIQNVISPVEAERKREFREAIDLSKDGRATRQELLMYIDPKNPRHAKEEAGTLMILADDNHDGKLSLDEILNKSELFLGSKMVDTASSFHDEF